jgi:hypothetical protein
MVGLVLVAVAAGLSAAALDVVAESARSGAREIMMFDHHLASPGSPAGAWILGGLALVVAVAWAAALAWQRGHRLERLIADELGRRRDHATYRDELTARRNRRATHPAN